MFTKVNAFFDLLAAALTTGSMFGLWLGMNPSRLPASVYVLQQQESVRGMNGVMPLLGATTILLTLVSAFEARNDRARLAFLLIASGCYLVAGLITRLANQPINAVVSRWAPVAPPPEWTSVRDRWWRWHVQRTALGVIGLCLLIAATVRTAQGH